MPEEKGKINAYICPNLHSTITINRDEGTTPFIIACRTCREHAKSMMYQVNQSGKLIKPSWEWFKPSEDELKFASQSERDHVKNGGLLLRPIG